MRKAYSILQKLFDDLWLIIFVELLAVNVLLSLVFNEDSLAGNINSIAGWILFAAIIVKAVYDIATARKQSGDSGDIRTETVKNRYPKVRDITFAAWGVVYFILLYIIILPRKPEARWLLIAIVVIMVVLLVLTIIAYRKGRLRNNS